MPLTPEQRRVVETVKGHLVVLAGPGSGKTHTITEKVLYLFRSGTFPEPYGVLAVTFTNAAANEMRSRLRSKGFRQWDRVWIGTFHGFGYYLLSCYGGDIGVREDFDIIEPDDQMVILDHIVSTQLRHVRADELRRQIELLKRQGVYPNRGDAQLASSLRAAYAEYQRLLTERNLLDFGDLVALAARLLSESELPRRLFTSFFRYIVVDEFQDTDRQQLEMVHMLAQRAVGSTIVADDDQSIYHFRGADRANVLAITKLLSAERVVLGANFRSDQVIVDAARAIIEHEKGRAPKKLLAVSRKRGHLHKSEFSDPVTEARQVVAWIKALKDGEEIEDWGEVAVITRHRWRVEWILKEMDAEKLPWFDRARLRFQDSWETTLALAVLALSCDLDSSERLFRVMTAVEDGGLAFFLGDEDALDVTLRIRDRLSMHLDFKSVPENAWRILEVAKVQEMIQTHSQSVSDYNRMSENLQTMVSDIVGVAQSLDLDLVEVTNRLAGYGAVQVISGHGSKGKEFDRVFLVGLEDDVLPDYRTHGKDADIDEERRIFYVCLTRARKAVYLTSSLERMMPWGDVQRKTPSRFIGHIPDGFFGR